MSFNFGDKANLQISSCTTVLLMLKFLGKGMEVISGVSYIFYSYSIGQGIISVPVIKYICPSYTLGSWKMGLWTHEPWEEWT